MLSAPAFAQQPAPAAKPGAAGQPAAPPAAPPPAPAPPAPAAPLPLSETLTGQAKADYESAKLLFSDGDNAGAAIKFKSAYDNSKDPRLLWNMAACEKNLRRYSRALKQLRQYVAEGGDKVTAQDRAEAQELIKVMEPFTAKLKIKVTEPGAEVYVDDELIGTSPIEPLVVDFGARKVRVRKPEFEEFTKELAVGGTAELAVDVALVKIVHEGHLHLKTQNEASISIDGKVVGGGSWSGSLPSGGHLIRITAPKKVAYQSEVYLQDKENRDLNVTLEDEPSKGVPTWMWIAGGVVVAGGVTTGVLMLSRSESTYEGPRGNLTGVGNSPGGIAELARFR